jgi:hypothetical protein
MSLDLSGVQAALAQVRNERAQNIELRRGETTLEAQSFRVERISRNAQYRSEAAKERRSDVIIMGAVDADIEEDDRFNDESGKLYRINFIEPNRSLMTLAEAVVAA